MQQPRDKNGRFVRFKPDYEAMYKEAHRDLECYKHGYKDLKECYKDLRDATNKLSGNLEECKERLKFLEENAPFWLRWMYRFHFNIHH